MSIILNEYEWAEQMIANHDLGKRPAETLSRVAKYYFANQYGKREIRGMLDTFLIQCDPSASLSGWSDTLDRIVRNVDRYSLIKIDGVEVSAKEMKSIEKLNGKQLRRLAFTLLCVAKYWYAVSEKNDYWVNTSDREVMQMANISTSIRRQSAMFAELKNAGMLRFSKKIDNLNVQVTFAEEGEPALYIQDFRNLGYQYLKYYGEPYFECENCGITVKIQDPSRGRRQKYCPGCAVEVGVRQRVNWVMRERRAVLQQAQSPEHEKQEVAC